jgi:hypothetical protein
MRYANTGHPLNRHKSQKALYLKGLGLAFLLQAHARGSLVDQIDGLVREKTIRDVPV